MFAMPINVLHQYRVVKHFRVTLNIMSKGKAPADIQKRRQEGRGKRQHNTESKSLKRPLLEILGIVGTLASVAGILTFLPRPTVIAGDPVDLDNPFSAAFTITNNNMVPLRHLSAKVALGDVFTEPRVFESVSHPRFSRENGSVARVEWQDHNLSMDERFTITPTDLFQPAPGVRLSGAEFGVVVEYNPWILPWRREKVFAFTTRKQTNGHLYWYSIPND
jgi:hypothetical protein